MSLDVSIEDYADPACVCEHCGKLTRRRGRVFDYNITHNLNKMAEAAGIYKHLWRPEELDITTAGQLIEPLQRGLELLVADPDRFKAFNPPNGWGTYDGLVAFVQRYLDACRTYPAGIISADR